MKHKRDKKELRHAAPPSSTLLHFRKDQTGEKGRRGETRDQHARGGGRGGGVGRNVGSVPVWRGCTTTLYFSSPIARAHSPTRTHTHTPTLTYPQTNRRVDGQMLGKSMQQIVIPSMHLFRPTTSHLRAITAGTDKKISSPGSR